MRYTIVINQQQCVKHGLDKNQGSLMDLLSQLSSWAKPAYVDSEVYYNLSYGKVVSELPMFFKSPDNVYRALNKLKKMGFIDQKKVGKSQQNFVKLTPKGKQFLRVGKNPEPSQGSEKIPRRVGKNPEPQNSEQTLAAKEIVVQGSEKIPTYNISTTSNNIYIDFPALGFLKKNAKEMIDVFEMQNKKSIANYDKFLEYFEIKVQEEEIEFTTAKLLGRLKRLKFNWKGNLMPSQKQEVELGAMPQMRKIG